MQNKPRALILLLLASTLATALASPALAEKAEVLTVAPTVVSKVWPKKQPKAPKAARPARVVDPVADRIKRLHKRMIAKQPLKDAELQDLADSGDGLAAFYYARSLEEARNPKLLPAATHYYAMASYLGREFAVKRLIALMKSPQVDLSEAQAKNGRDALVKLASAGQTTAALGLSDMYAIGRPFAQDSAQSRQWLMKAAQSGDSAAAQKLAQAAMMPADGSPPDEPTARVALALMIASNEPGKVAMAQTLLARLGPADAPAPTDATEISQ